MSSVVLPVEDHSSNGTESETPKLDDLEWLVGRWRCYARCYLTRVARPLGSHAEDSLEYFNVYLPFGDDHLTLLLTTEPQDREIAAEFLVRHVSPGPRFEERLGVMAPWGRVFIGRDRIVVRESPLYVVEFRYKLDVRDQAKWLILESRGVRLELLKLESVELGDIRDSKVAAPIKDYSKERIADVRKRYERLKAFPDHGQQSR